jgi:hypothetical protein
MATQQPTSSLPSNLGGSFSHLAEVTPSSSAAVLTEIGIPNNHQPYISVQQLICEKVAAKHGFTAVQVQEQLLHLFQAILRHQDDEQRLTLTQEELAWLTELIYWEEICEPPLPHSLTEITFLTHPVPDEKEAFPGVRPPRSNRARCVRGFVPPCGPGATDGSPEEECPFVRHLPCENAIHGRYKLRLGSDWEGCPVCYTEKLEAVKEAEEQTGSYGWVEYSQAKRRRLV